MIHIYLKTHNITGLRYLGKTKNDPLRYKGSGKRWLNHLRVHGNDVHTTILQTCSDNEQVKHWGLYYSSLWDVVNDQSFANLTEERGDGGPTFRNEVINQLVGDKLREHNKTLSAEYKTERARRAGRAFWVKVKSDPNLAAHISKVRKQQRNPMLGKQQKRVCCLGCRRDLPINQLTTHMCK
jgi:hypothetical protein